jgi:hypothetical protein
MSCGYAFAPATVLARASSNALTSSARLANFDAGFSTSGACSFRSRLRIISPIFSSVACERFSAGFASAAAFSTIASIIDSDSVTCSAISAIDHLSAAGLYFHCDSETSSIDARNALRDCSRCSINFCRSADISEWLPASRLDAASSASDATRNFLPGDFDMERPRFRFRGGGRLS